MTVRRTLATSSLALVLVAALAGCFGPAPTLPGTGGNPDPADPQTPTEVYDLTGTSWSGTDSDGDFWAFEFQADGTVGLTYLTDTWDEDVDVWEVSGGTLTITTVFDQGDVVFIGPVSEGSMDLAATYPGGAFTITVTED